MMRIVLRALAIGLILLGCTAKKKEPCTKCLSVKTEFSETRPDASIACDDYALGWDGRQTTVEVAQDGSSIAVGMSLGRMEGTLFNDNTASFGPLVLDIYDAEGGVQED